MANPSDQKRIIAMRTGGRLLGQVREQLVAFTAPGMTFAQIEAEAQRLIAAAGAKPSFSTVPGYSWATCIMKNDELCHGIPSETKVVESGDIITVDVGLLYDGYHLDTTTTFGVGSLTPQQAEFLVVGRRSLEKAINRVRVGASIYDVSRAMQKEVQRHGYDAVYQLTGHGIGTQLHMEPSVPCVADKRQKHVYLKEGQTLAIEIMYARGRAHVVVDPDGWTYRTEDGSLSGMFEETVLVTRDGAEVLTRG